MTSERIDAVWTVPNLLSMLRLALVPVFLWLVLGPEADGWAFVVLMVAGFTDWADGFVARRMGTVSRLGVLLDPLADRLYIAAALIGLVLREIIPVWLVVVLLARELLLASLLPSLRRHGVVALPVHYVGKAATLNLLYAFPLLFLGDGTGTAADIARIVGWAFVTWGVVLYWYAAVLYVAQVRALIKATT